MIVSVETVPQLITGGFLASPAALPVPTSTESAAETLGNLRLGQASLNLCMQVLLLCIPVIQVTDWMELN